MSTSIVASEKAAGGVYVFLEQTSGTLEDVSLEVLGKAREIADRLITKVYGILLGENIRTLAEVCSKRGADVVLTMNSSLLKDFTSEGYLRAVYEILRNREADIVLIGATHNGTTLASSLAVKLNAGLMAHVVDLEVEQGTGALLGSVPGFGGSIVAVCKCKKKPQMATVRTGIFKPLPMDESRVGRIEELAPVVSPSDMKCKVLEKYVGADTGINRASEIVIAGLGCTENLSMARRLAEDFNASFGVSRPLADKGIAKRDLVVGSTGSSLNANVAIILGVSGAAHFTSGIRDVKTVIAINKDPDATIFKHADYCVKGNVYEIIPALIEQLESNKKVVGGD